MTYKDYLDHLVIHIEKNQKINQLKIYDDQEDLNGWKRLSVVIFTIPIVGYGFFGLEIIVICDASIELF